MIYLPYAGALLGLFVILGRDEGHLDNLCRINAASHLDFDSLAYLGMGGGDVAHGDVLLKGRGGTPARYLSNLLFSFVQNHGIFCRAVSHLTKDWSPLAGAPWTTSPTLFRETPSLICFWMTSAPRNPPSARRRFPGCISASTGCDVTNCP